MQKVVGSSPIIRSDEAPETGLFSCASRSNGSSFDSKSAHRVLQSIDSSAKTASRLTLTHCHSGHAPCSAVERLQDLTPTVRRGCGRHRSKGSAAAATFL